MSNKTRGSIRRINHDGKDIIYWCRFLRMLTAFPTTYFPWYCSLRVIWISTKDKTRISPFIHYSVHWKVFAILQFWVTPVCPYFPKESRTVLTLRSTSISLKALNCCCFLSATLLLLTYHHQSAVCAVVSWYWTLFWHLVDEVL